MDSDYTVLGLKPGASSGEIKHAYRDLVKVWHPDRFAHDPALRRKAEEKLKEINEAYGRLKGRAWRMRFRRTPRAEAAGFDAPRASAGWGVPRGPAVLLVFLLVLVFPAYAGVQAFLDYAEIRSASRAGSYRYAVLDAVSPSAAGGEPIAFRLVAKTPGPRSCEAYLRNQTGDIFKSRRCEKGDGRFEAIFNHESRDSEYLTFHDPAARGAAYPAAIILDRAQPSPLEGLASTASNLRPGYDFKRCRRKEISLLCP